MCRFHRIIHAMQLLWLLAAVQAYARTTHVELVTAKEIDRQIVTAVQSHMEEQGIPGLSLALVHKDKILFAEGFGLATIKTNKPATKNTVYGLASVSKVFTATAFMQLVEKGLIDLHAPVVNTLPDFYIAEPRRAPSYRDGASALITPFNLMIHYAGMPKNAPPRRNLIDEPQTLTEFMDDLYREAHLIHEPNFRYSYSNPGISVLGRILEVVTEKDFESLMQEQLLRPLNMKRSSFSNTGFSPDIVASLAQGYSDYGVPVSRPPIRGVPAGNLHSSVVDVANFIIMYLNSGVFNGKTLLRRNTINTMFTVQNRELRDKDPEHRGPEQGLVWVLNNRDIPGAPKTARHNGKMVGYSSVLILLPDEQLGIVVLTNIRNDTIKPTPIALSVLAIARDLVN